MDETASAGAEVGLCNKAIRFLPSRTGCVCLLLAVGSLLNAPEASAQAMSGMILDPERAILEGRLYVADTDRLNAIRSLDALASCSGPSGDFTTRIWSHQSGDMVFVQRYGYRSDTLVAGIRDGRGWQRDSSSRIAPIGEEATAFFRGHDFLMTIIDPRGRLGEPVVARRDTFQGVAVVTVDFSGLGGAAVHYAADDARPIGITYPNPVSQEAPSTHAQFDDWREHGELRLPQVIRLIQDESIWEYRFTSVGINTVQPEEFDPLRVVTAPVRPPPGAASAGLLEERVEFGSEGGWVIAGDLVTPAGELRPPVVLLLNTLWSGNRSVYVSLARQLAQGGLASLRIDLRGHGESVNLRSIQPGAVDTELIYGAWPDVLAARSYLQARSDVDASRLAVVGASYSAEVAARAGREGGYADAYVMLAGDLSSESIHSLASEGPPWVFAYAADDHTTAPATAALIDRFRAAAVWSYQHGGHATDLLGAHPDLGWRITEWLRDELK